MSRCNRYTNDVRRKKIRKILKTELDSELYTKFCFVLALVFFLFVVASSCLFSYSILLLAKNTEKKKKECTLRNKVKTNIFLYFLFHVSHKFVDAVLIFLFSFLIVSIPFAFLSKSDEIKNTEGPAKSRYRRKRLLFTDI
jgi:hypothetical protein